MDNDDRKTPPPQISSIDSSDGITSNVFNSSTQCTPNRKNIILNPESPAYIPTFVLGEAAPGSPIQEAPLQFRLEAPEFTPTKMSLDDIDDDSLHSSPLPSSGSYMVSLPPPQSASDPALLIHPLNSASSSEYRKSWKKSSNYAMANRMWRNEELTEELSFYNHWLLFHPEERTMDSGRTSDSRNIYGLADSGFAFLEPHGFSAVIPFEGTGLFDISLKLPPAKFKIEGCTTVRARKVSSAKLCTIIIIKGVEVNDGSTFAKFDALRRFQSPSCLRIIESFTTHHAIPKETTKVNAPRPTASDTISTSNQPVLVVSYEACHGACRLLDVLSCLSLDDCARFVFGWVAQLLVMVFSAHQSSLAFDEVLRLENLLLTPSGEKIILIGFGLPELLYSGGFSTTGTVPKMEDRQERDYEALRNIIDYLIMPLGSRADVALRMVKVLNELPPVWKYSVEQLGRAILTCQLYDQVIMSLNRRVNKLEAELAKQLENDRLFRLMVKFCFICERQSYAHDHNWSETGERYVIKLFRDYVFHSQDEDGQPVLDPLHVLDCLNKLDAGSREMVMLTSRKGDQFIFATYAEIRKRLEAAYEELLRGS